jgi:hypothetical protein
MFLGGSATAAQVGNSNVLSGVIAVCTVVVAVLQAWSSKRDGDLIGAAERSQAAVEHLARQMLGQWQPQARARGITTSVPMAVRWRWASDDVAVQPGLDAVVATDGLVSHLRDELYERLPAESKLVLLGGVGAGKTTAMMLLLINILRQRPAGSAEPIPVWVTLGGWNPHTTSLHEWAAAALRRDFPGLTAPVYGGSSAVDKLVAEGRVVLFLDGLDEMPPAFRGTALNRIDVETQGGRAVLTSRFDEYREALEEGRLWDAAVIDLLPIEAGHASAFLLAGHLREGLRAWRRVTDHLVSHPDSIAARTLVSPLSLSLARDAYSRADPTDLLDTRAHPTTTALMQHLLIESLNVAYPDPVKRENVSRRLTWIARRLGTGRDLRWWDIPTWMSSEPRELRTALSLMFGLGGGLIAGVGGGILNGLRGVWGSVLVAVLIGWYAAGRADQPLAKPKQPHIFIMRKPGCGELVGLLVVGLVVGLGSGLTSVIAVVVLKGPGGPSEGKVAVGLWVGVAAGLVFGVVSGLATLWGRPMATAKAASPIEVYRSDWRHTVVRGLTSAIIGGVLIGFLTGLTRGLMSGLVVGIVGGLNVGLPIGLATKFGPAAQLNTMELVWALRGRRVRFLPLLQDALDKQVLRQVGAIYQFRHAALQDLLANLDGHPAEPSDGAPHRSAHVDAVVPEAPRNGPFPTTEADNGQPR